MTKLVEWCDRFQSASRTHSNNIDLWGERPAYYSEGATIVEMVGEGSQPLHMRLWWMASIVPARGR